MTADQQFFSLNEEISFGEGVGVSYTFVVPEVLKSETCQAFQQGDVSTHEKLL